MSRGAAPGLAYVLGWMPARARGRFRVASCVRRVLGSEREIARLSIAYQLTGVDVEGAITRLEARRGFEVQLLVDELRDVDPDLLHKAWKGGGKSTAKTVDDLLRGGMK